MGLFSKNTKTGSTDIPQQNTEHQPAAPNPLENLTSSQLLKKVLEELGCQYEEKEHGEDEFTFFFTYQGEQIQCQGADDSKYILLRDLWWYSAPLHDINNISFMRRAVNDCNIRGYVTLIYSFDEESKEMWVHSQTELLWTWEIPSLAQYFRNRIDRMLRSHHFFFATLEELRRKEYAKQND